VRLPAWATTTRNSNSQKNTNTISLLVLWTQGQRGDFLPKFPKIRPTGVQTWDLGCRQNVPNHWARHPLARPPTGSNPLARPNHWARPPTGSDVFFTC